MKILHVPAINSREEFTEKYAQESIDCINWKSFPYCPKVSFRIAHTDKAICIEFSVEEAFVRAVCTESNGAVWEDSCVEFFVKEPDEPYYFNFETNCIGTGLAARRISKSDAAHFTAEEMNRIVRRSSLPHEPIDKTDGSWTLYLEVPFDVIGCQGVPERLRANFYKCGDRTAIPHFVSWNPIGSAEPNFHLPEFFGELIIEK